MWDTPPISYWYEKLRSLGSTPVFGTHTVEMGFGGWHTRRRSKGVTFLLASAKSNGEVVPTTNDKEEHKIKKKRVPNNAILCYSPAQCSTFSYFEVLLLSCYIYL